jgi:hypothetical protein
LAVTASGGVQWQYLVDTLSHGVSEISNSLSLHCRYVLPHDIPQIAGVTMAYLRSYVTGSNDAILNEVGRTAAVSLVGARHGPGGASRRSFGTHPRGPAGQRQSRCLD